MEVKVIEQYSNVEKYFDIYDNTTDSSSNYSTRILGDATAETRAWYNDSAYFVSTTSPWFQRGGEYENTNSNGIFTFYSTSGNSSSNRGNSTYRYYSSRLVLSPSN